MDKKNIEKQDGDLTENPEEMHREDVGLEPSVEAGSEGVASAVKPNVFQRFLHSVGGWFQRKGRNIKTRFQNYKSLSGKDKRRWWVDFLLNNAIYIIFVIFIIFVWIYCLATDVGNFLSLGAIGNLINRTAFSCFLALGVGGVIVLTGTDLSAGRIMGFIACICASLLQATGLSNKMWPELSPPPLFLVFLIAIVIGAIFGFINGFFTAKFKMHPFISTLGTSMIVAGLVLMYVNMGNNGGVSISGLDAAYFSAINGTFSLFGLIDLPYYVIYAAVAVLVTWFLWNKTRLGKNMYAVGANPEAANVSGVSVFWTTVILFIFAGVMYGVSGFVDAARVGSNNAATGVGFELNAIAACVIGGVSFTGGVGKVSGIMLGVVLLQLVSVGLQWLGVAPYFQSIITGLIILFAVAVDMRKYVTKR